MLLFVAVLSPQAFEIGDTSGADFADYEHGGIAVQVKVPKKISFVS